jgi:DNA-binding MarR family transcriptional regulator
VDDGTGGSLATAWRQLLAQHAAVSGALERALQERHGLGMSEYQVLEVLVEAGAEPLRAQRLGESVYLSQSALSRVIGRLEKAGLVTRCLCAEDRRGIYVEPTEAGRATYAQARPTQRDVLAHTLSGIPASGC